MGKEKFTIDFGNTGLGKKNNTTGPAPPGYSKNLRLNPIATTLASPVNNSEAPLNLGQTMFSPTSGQQTAFSPNH